MVTAERAWAALAVVVLTYEIKCPPNQLLSQGIDRWLLSHPAVTRATVLVTALHLLNLLPPQVDPYSILHVLRQSRHSRR